MFLLAFINKVMKKAIYKGTSPIYLFYMYSVCNHSARNSLFKKINLSYLDKS
jgi:hypothetical protein